MCATHLALTAPQVHMLRDSYDEARHIATDIQRALRR